MRSFKPDERFELPNGQIVFARITLMVSSDMPGRAHPVYQVTVNGVLASPVFATFIDCDGNRRPGPAMLELSALDVEDLRPTQ